MDYFLSLLHKFQGIPSYSYFKTATVAILGCTWLVVVDCFSCILFFVDFPSGRRKDAELARGRGRLWQVHYGPEFRDQRCMCFLARTNVKRTRCGWRLGKAGQGSKQTFRVALTEFKWIFCLTSSVKAKLALSRGDAPRKVVMLP